MDRLIHHKCKQLKFEFNYPRELTSVGRDIAFHIQGLKFEP